MDKAKPDRNPNGGDEPTGAGGSLSRRTMLGAVGAFGFLLGAQALVNPSAAFAAVPFPLSNPYTGWVKRDDFAAHVRRGSLGPGVDYGLPNGTPVAAPGAGSIRYTQGTSSGGYFATITHPAGYRSQLLHLSAFAGGARNVVMGEIIGYSGGIPGRPGAGSSTGAHLHWSLIAPSGHIDPLPQVNTVAGQPIPPIPGPPAEEVDLDMPIYELVRAQDQATVWYCVDRIHRYAIPDEGTLTDYKFFIEAAGQDSTVKYPVLNLNAFGRVL
jgi:murein DD-endopeptidase MepM/ murein hydrolase activator NlpD